MSKDADGLLLIYITANLQFLYKIKLVCSFEVSTWFKLSF